MKQAILYPVRKFFTLPMLSPVIASLLKKNPNSRVLRGICPSHLLFGKQAIKKVERKGLGFELRLYDYMDWLLFFHSDTDSSTPLLEFVKKDDIVLDIGGNIGQTALLVAQKTGPGGKVISFEPVPDTYNRFIKNLSLNPDVKNITLEKIALGNTRTKLKMAVEEGGNSGQNRIAHNGTGENMLEVEAMPLTTYVESNPLPRIDLIKIDVEGFEYSVLEGAAAVIRQFKPLLYIELDDANLRQQGRTANDLIHFIQGLDYVVTDVETNKQLTEFSGGHTDIICRPK